MEKMLHPREIGDSLTQSPAGIGSNFPPGDIKIGSALKERFSTIWHYGHNRRALRSSAARGAVDRVYLGHRFRAISVIDGCICFGKMLSSIFSFLFTTCPSVPSLVLNLFCGACGTKTLLIKNHFPSFVFAEGETDLLEMHAFGVQFNLIDRECIWN